MRTKDIKSIGANNGVPDADGLQKSDKDRDTKTDIEGDSQDKMGMVVKRKQDLINLITVDAQRLTDFLSYNSQ